MGFVFSGVLILGIIREDRTLNNPGSDERILSGDRLVLSGTKEQLRKAIQMPHVRAQGVRSNRPRAGILSCLARGSGDWVAPLLSTLFVARQSWVADTSAAARWARAAGADIARFGEVRPLLSPWHHQ